VPEPERPLDSAGFAKAAYEAALGREFPTDVFCAPQLRWAVIGCGVIANQMADSLALAGRRIEGVANRHAEKARAFAAAHGVPRVYQTFEELYADPDIDAIYITTPHNTHIGFLRGALAAGKHVLCEKPLASNAREARQMVAVARECGVTGARMMGGGFGGCTINLVKDDLFADFIATAKRKFTERFGHEPKVYPVVISDGAHKID